MSDLVVKVGGEGGSDSPLTAGEFITLSAIREGNTVFTMQTLPAQIKGGLASYQVRMSDRPIVSQGDAVDALFCMNQESYDVLLPDLRPDGGVLVYDSNSVTLREETNGYVQYGVPMSNIASKELRERRSKNMVLLGAFSELFGVPMETFKQCVDDKYGRRSADIVKANYAALDAGATWVRENLERQHTHLFEPNPELMGARRMVINGSDAVGMGAAMAKCQIYAGYPITPASEIMHWLAKQLPKFGGTVIQTEDEISALGACLGASFAGAKVMTATSGPGLSLMVELLGLAVMAEIPVVIVDVMRGGPSTGLPTKCEDGDLNLAIYGAHGDAPRIVLAPANIHDLTWDTIGAFNLAEKYQTPVIVLSDQSMAMRTQAIKVPDLSAVQLEERALQLEPDPDYERYALTGDGVSPIALPGGEGGAFYTVTGLAHDTFGNPAVNDGHMSTVYLERRQQKIESARHETGWSRTFGPETATVGIISWGSIEGAVAEAVERLGAEGLETRALHLRMLYPLPTEEIEAFAATVDRLFVCELNFSGQLYRFIRSRMDVKPSLIHKYDGLPFTARNVMDAVREEM